MQSKTVYRILMIIVILLFVTVQIASCTFDGDIIPTRTPTATTQTCPTITIATPDPGEGYRKSVFVILVQPDPYYVYSSTAFEVINAVIPQVIEPGDDIYLLRMGIFTFDFNTAIIYNGGASDLSHRSIPATPTYQPTTTGTNTPMHTPQSGVAQQGATQSALQTQSAMLATATQREFLHNCAMLEWEDQYQQQATDWEAERTQAVGGLSSQVRDSITYYQTQIPTIPTAQPNMVYESLVNATVIFDHYECGSDDRCFLIIFSDLYDPRRTPPEYIDADLTGVFVYSVLFHCNPLFEPSCQVTQGDWTNAFSYYGAYPPTFFNGENIVSTLTTNLRQRR